MARSMLHTNVKLQNAQLWARILFELIQSTFTLIYCFTHHYYQIRIELHKNSGNSSTYVCIAVCQQLYLSPSENVSIVLSTCACSSYMKKTYCFSVYLSLLIRKDILNVHASKYMQHNQTSKCVESVDNNKKTNTKGSKANVLSNIIVFLIQDTNHFLNTYNLTKENCKHRSQIKTYGFFDKKLVWFTKENILKINVLK